MERISIGNHSRISLPVHLHFQNVHVGDIFDEEGNINVIARVQREVMAQLYMVGVSTMDFAG